MAPKGNVSKYISSDSLVTNTVLPLINYFYLKQSTLSYKITVKSCVSELHSKPDRIWMAEHAVCVCTGQWRDATKTWNYVLLNYSYVWYNGLVDPTLISIIDEGGHPVFWRSEWTELQGRAGKCRGFNNSRLTGGKGRRRESQPKIYSQVIDTNPATNSYYFIVRHTAFNYMFACSVYSCSDSFITLLLSDCYH